jgi:hypothetical protein
LLVMLLVCIMTLGAAEVSLPQEVPWKKGFHLQDLQCC